jgi:hypothetical protein
MDLVLGLRRDPQFPEITRSSLGIEEEENLPRKRLAVSSLSLQYK